MFMCISTHRDQEQMLYCVTFVVYLHRYRTIVNSSDIRWPSCPLITQFLFVVRVSVVCRSILWFSVIRFSTQTQVASIVRRNLRRKIRNHARGEEKIAKASSQNSYHRLRVLSEILQDRFIVTRQLGICLVFFVTHLRICVFRSGTKRQNNLKISCFYLRFASGHFVMIHFGMYIR